MATLGEAMDNTLSELERRAPDTAALFKNELATRMENHNIGWRQAPDSMMSGIAPEILQRARQVLDALPGF